MLGMIGGNSQSPSLISPAVLEGPVPTLKLIEDDQAANEKLWELDVQGKTLLLSTRNDADSSGVAALTIVRGTGTAITSTTLNATTSVIMAVGGSAIGTWSATGLAMNSLALSGITTLGMSGTLTLGTSQAINGTTSVIQQVGGSTIGTWSATGLAMNSLALSGVTTIVAATSLSVPSIITASGALGITPAAGSNLNVTLSTTGDFAVNTNQLYVDTSAARVGINNAAPTVPLDVVGAALFSSTLGVVGNINGEGNVRGGADGAFYWVARSTITSPSDGNIVISNQASNDFSKLQFGGTTSSFPSIKRNATAINFRLADDSADASISSNSGTFSGYINRSVGNALTATGTDRATALQLAKEINNVTTAAASTGVVLPVGVAGMIITVFNAGANPIQVYATASETIDGVAGATGVPLTNAKRCNYFFTAANTWISAQLGVISA